MILAYIICITISIAISVGLVAAGYLLCYILHKKDDDWE